MTRGLCWSSVDQSADEELDGGWWRRKSFQTCGILVANLVCTTRKVFLLKSPYALNQFPYIYRLRCLLLPLGNAFIIPRNVPIVPEQKPFHHLRVSGITSGDVELFNGTVRLSPLRSVNAQ